MSVRQNPIMLTGMCPRGRRATHSVGFSPPPRPLHQSYTYNAASLSFFRSLSSTSCVYNNNIVITIGPMLYASHYTPVHMGTTAVVILSRLILLLRSCSKRRRRPIYRIGGKVDDRAEHAACTSAKRDTNEMRISGIILWWVYHDRELRCGILRYCS